MKLLHIFPSFAAGGQQRRLALLAQAMPDLRHTITALDGNYAAGALFDAEISWQQAPARVAKGLRALPDNICDLRRVIEAEQPDLLCTYNWGSIEAVLANRRLPGKALRVPHLHFEDGFGPDEPDGQQKWQRVLMRRLALANLPVVVPSQTLAVIARDKWRLANVRHISNGVDLDRFGTDQIRTGRRTVIGTVGALRPEKNLARLVQAFSDADLARQARLVVVGDGPARAGLERLTAELGLGDHVRFAGHTDTPEQAYAEFDIFALTSDTEQMPFGVLEAMASGLPVVATDVGDIAAMVAPENRPYVVPPGAPALLAGALDKLAHDRSLRDRIGAANRARAEAEFSQQQMIEACWRLFEEVSGVSAAPGTR